MRHDTVHPREATVTTQRHLRGRRSAVGGKLRSVVLLGAVLTVTATGPGGVSAATTVSTAPVVAFMAAGDVGGGVLEPGTTFPPTSRGFATLERGSNWVQVNIQSSGLPAGAYTVWWVVFNTPDGCAGGCGEDDLLNPDANVSVFWAAGGIVQDNGVSNFRDRHAMGDDLGEPGSQHILGDGSLNPAWAEIHNVIKYHGPASNDLETLHEQTHTILGGCFEGANAVDLGAPFGVHCFDPQAVVHALP